MTMRMLIDARHPEETRVAVVKGSRIEEFDFESAEHKQLKGNIYLAKVTRVEPSLQAAFIDYGGNRHGFLAFSEIHPDYYQIPKADRDALLREEAEHAAEEERLRSAGYGDGDDHHYDEEASSETDAGTAQDTSSEASGATATDASGETEESGATETGTGSNRSPVDESAADELRTKRQNLRRRYKIQDVIQRRQVLLVQVVKEERGNKGAALTTYLSLAGRYCVLMPNTSHGGGISRKIPNGADRKRLKSIMADLSLPSTMGLIVRTAGLSRTKTEIKRDFDYLARLWDEIREKTLGSSAPALIYRDSDLIKRAIRDLYHREIDEVTVEGEDGYKAARGFMKLLMPSHVRRVKLHSESVPLFQRQGVEDQLSAMYQPLVQLKSGGYLVINPTEALVSIDINSGRSTREHNIEQTAFATNLEAAAEIARQLRLRDMAGLVVIDFIDMEQSSHVRKVERAMKDALRNDRARIQVGRISSFGLMEMSRQRLRTGVLEASTRPCVHCEGTGLMRTASSAGLSALRLIDDEAARGRGEKILLRAGRDAAIYVLNKKRSELADIELRYGVSIDIVIDETFEGARMAVDSSGPRPIAPVGLPQSTPQLIDEDDDDFDAEDLEEAEEDEAAEQADDDDFVEISLEGAEAADAEEGGEDRNGRRRRRRRRGGRGRGRRDQEGGSDHAPEALTGDPAEQADAAEPETAVATHTADAETPDAEAERPARTPRRRRGRRSETPSAETVEPESSPMVERPIDQEPPIAEMRPAGEPEPEPEPAPKPRRSRRKAATSGDPAEAAPTPETTLAAEPVTPTAETADSGDEPAAKPPARKRRTKASLAKDSAATDEAAPGAAAAKEDAAAPVSAANDDARAADASGSDASGSDASGSDDGDGGEARRGWWQRTFG